MDDSECGGADDRYLGDQHVMVEQASGSGEANQPGNHFSSHNSDVRTYRERTGEPERGGERVITGGGRKRMGVKKKGKEKRGRERKGEGEAVSSYLVHVAHMHDPQQTYSDNQTEIGA